MPWPDTILSLLAASHLMKPNTEVRTIVSWPISFLTRSIFKLSLSTKDLWPRVQSISLPYNMVYRSQTRVSCVLHRDQTIPPSWRNLHSWKVRPWQMRDRFVSIIGRNLVIPKLYGNSAMSPRFSVYEYNQTTNPLLLPSITRDATFVTDVAPADRWSYELLEDGGETKMRELVEEVKVMCNIACAWRHTSSSIFVNDNFVKEANFPLLSLRPNKSVSESVLVSRLV